MDVNLDVNIIQHTRALKPYLPLHKQRPIHRYNVYALNVSRKNKPTLQKSRVTSTPALGLTPGTAPQGQRGRQIVGVGTQNRRAIQGR